MSCDVVRSVAIVTPGASVTFFRPEFNDFLYAPIGADGNDMPLSVLSALSRMNVDPWKEAAELSELPKDTATQRLASLIARMPGGRWALADARIIADRLIELLPLLGNHNTPSAEKARGVHGTNVPAMLLIAAAFVVAALIYAANREPSSRGDQADAPAYSTASPPQTSVPISR
jgi:hypothetical protein